MEPQPTSLYCYYDGAGVLLYVGITKRGPFRNVEHNTCAEWWPLVTRQEITHFQTRTDAKEAERNLITTLHPRFNVHFGVNTVRRRRLLAQLAATKDEREARLGDYMLRKGLNRQAAETELLTFALDSIDARRRGGFLTGNRPQQEKHLARARKARAK